MHTSIVTADTKVFLTMAFTCHFATKDVQSAPTTTATVVCRCCYTTNDATFGWVCGDHGKQGVSVAVCRDPYPLYTVIDKTGHRSWSTAEALKWKVIVKYPKPILHYDFSLHKITSSQLTHQPIISHSSYGTKRIITPKRKTPRRTARM